MPDRIMNYLGALVLTILAAPMLAQGVPQALNFKFNENSGTTTANTASPGAGNPVVTFPATPPTWVAPGRLGASALNFAAATQPITTGFAPALTSTDAWTIEFWLRKVSTAARYPLGSGSTATSLRSYHTGGNCHLYSVNTGPGGGTIANLSGTGGLLGLNTWHHVAFVYDPTVPEARIYYDGVLNTVQPGTTALAATDFTIGGRAPGDTLFFDGDLDDFRFWTVARTASEIQAFMNVELPLVGDATFLSNRTSSWPLMTATATDEVHLDFEASVLPNTQTITSLTVTRTGTVTDAQVTSVKLVRDNNNNGVADAGDTTLGTTVFSGGLATFTGAPLVSVTPTASVRLLVALTYSSLPLNSNLRVELASASAVTWGGGTDYTSYPMQSPERTVEPPQYPLGLSSGGGNAIPFASTQTRYLTVYSAQEMSGLVPGSQITALRIHGVTDPNPLGTWGNMVVRVGRSDKDPNTLDNTFDNNYTGAPVTVLDQANFQPTRIAGTAQLARFEFQFTTPFTYTGGGLCVEYQITARSGTGFNITSNGGRQRLYSTVAGLPVTGTLATLGNYGLDLMYTNPTSGVAMSNMLAGPPALATPQVDGVGLALALNAFATPSALNSLTVTRLGTITDAQISNMKLVRDNNNDGMVDAGDTVLGSGVLSAGRITFTGAPLTAIPTGNPTQLLVAFSIPTALQGGTTVGFEISAAADAVFTTAPDLTSYPVASQLAAQRMGGNYTINQTAGDYADLGAAFDALETFGVSAPVTFTFTDSATYVVTPSYSLGANGSTIVAVDGAGGANTITIRAAAGQRPVLSGAAVPDTYTAAAFGTLAFRNIGNITIEGIDFTGGNQFGIMLYSSTAGSSDNYTIRKCRFHGITTGAAIYMYGSSGTTAANNVLIENNMFWDVGGFFSGIGGGTGQGPVGVIGGRRVGTNFVVRHNTILHQNAVAGSAVFYSNGSTAPAWADLSYNAVYLDSSSAVHFFGNASAVLPVTANRNVVYLGGSANMSNDASVATWALWQGSGRDTNGVNADPQFMNIGATPDLHIMTTSPAVDLAVGSTTPDDFDGDIRPQGAAPDAGADEAILGPPPVMDVRYNTAIVAPAGNVNLGNVILLGDMFTFTVENTGVGDLQLFASPPVQITLGTNCDPGTVVQTQPALTTIPSPGNTTFVVYADPAALGAFDFTITIPNNDPTKNPYTFTVSGNGVPNNGQAVADPATGSTFSGNTNGPFTLALNPGDNLVSAEIELTDPETDSITVVSITQPTPAATGIVTPTIPAPGHPLTLAWTGTADGSNAPGNYTWVVEFVDAVNGTPRMVDVTITINDVPPAHGPVAGQPGLGTVVSPYTADYTVSLTGAVVTDLADVTDPNVGQVVSITNQARTGGTAGTGTGFLFALSGGVLRVNPAGTLVAADLGTQIYTVTVSDGGQNADITVEITVNDLPSFVTTTLADAVQNTPYTEVIQTTGGSGALTVAVSSGTLPAGIALSASGDFSGVTFDPAATFNFIVTVTDSLGASSNQAFALELVAPAGGIPVITTPSPLPNAIEGGTYGPVALQATGGVAPYTWAVTGGTLPTGLTLSTAGEISGTATVLGSNSFTIEVTDSVGVKNTAPFSLTVVTAPTGGSGSGSSGSSGCVAGTGSSLIGLLAIASTGLAALRRRRK